MSHRRSLLAASATQSGGGGGANSLFSWGYGNNGVTGLGNTTSVSSPTQVGSSSWTSVFVGGSAAIGVSTSGKLYSWGSNPNGVLGQGDVVVKRSTPTQIGTGSSWASAVIGASNQGFAIKTDGTLWAWGQNYAGQLGDGTVTDKSSPVQVGSGTAWAQVSAGQSFALARKTDGTLWAWGYNAYGTIGNGTVGTKLSSPVQVGSGTNWAEVASGARMVIARTTTGTVFTWGYNSQGNLGHGDVGVNRSSPTQLGSGAGWTQVFAGFQGGFTAAGVKSGAAFAWGNASTGRLGNGDLNPRSSPTQIGSGTTWSSVKANSQGFGIKTDGTAWTWGNGASGSSGQGDVGVSRSSPVQLGTAANWSSGMIGTPNVGMGIRT